MHPFDSDTVLAEHGCPTLPSSRSERTYGHPQGVQNRNRPATFERKFEMKQLLIVMTLVVASAAAAMAEGFPNPYLTQANR